MTSAIDPGTPATGLSGPLERVMRQVLAMQEAGDIQHLIREVWDVLGELDFDFLSCAFVLVDEERDWLSSYNVWTEETVDSFYRTGDALRHAQRLGEGLIMFSGQTSLAGAPALYQEAIAAWRSGRVERHVLSPSEIEEVARLNSQRYGSRMTADTYPIRCHLHVPFPHGVFSLRTDGGEFDPFADHQVDFLTRLVHTISIGYERYHEFRRLDRDRTVQRLRAEVQAMRSSDDIVDLMGQLWQELGRAGIDFRYMSIAVSDGEADDVQLYAAASQDRRDTIGQYPLLQEEVAPGVDLHYRRVERRVWDQYHTEFTGCHRVDSDGVPGYATRASQLWGIEASVARIDFDAMTMMAAALPQGRIFVAHMQGAGEPPLPDFTPEDQEVLAAFAEALGLGFTRFFDFQRLERYNRDLEVQRSVDRVRAEVASMRQSTDIGDVAVLLGEQLTALGVESSSSSFSIIDDEAGLVRYYAVGPAHYLQYSHNVIRRDRSVLGELIDMEDCIVVIPDILPGLDLLYTTEPLRDAPAFADRGRPPRLVRRREADAQRDLADYRRRWRAPSLPLSLVPRSVIRVPFSHGSIALVHFEPDRFSQDDVDLVAAYADAVSLGFTRFHDFQRLEGRNRELEIERAVEQVQLAVQSMKVSADILPVIALLSQELQGLGLEYSWCTISLVDEEADRVRVYGTAGTDLSFGKSAQWEQLIAQAGHQELSFGSDTMERLESEEGPFFIVGIPGQIGYANYMSAPLDSYHGSVQHIGETTIVSRSDEEAREVSQEYARRWRVPEWREEMMLRSTLRTPFAGGTIALSHSQRDKLGAREARILERFAEAFSLGYARYLDFRHLDERNRELEIERAVGRVQIAVQNMKTSADILPVMVLLFEEMQRLGFDYRYFSVSIVDPTAQRVQVYVTGEILSDWNAPIVHRLEDLGPDVVAQLDSEGPLCFAGTGSDGQIVSIHYMSAPLDSYHGALQRTRETTITSRSDEEVKAVLPELARRWKTDSWPKEFWPRSGLRVPFAGGTIALTDPRPDFFTESDARTLERFAAAFTLGYTRYLDFRRLEEQNRALEAASHVKSEFLANMSHELRTPMNAIINFSSMVLDGVCGEISDDVRDVVGEIDENGERLLALINDVLDLSKIEAGAMQLERAPCDPAACVENAAGALEHSAREKGLELRTEIEEMPSLLADERRLTQHVLTNLVKNAVKFTDRGTVEVGVRREGRDVLFWVRDTGVGVPPDEQERIFETFHQVDTSITRRAEGTGLGLAIARRYVELHRGRIWVESEEGRGSTFYVAIPVST